MKCTHLLRSAAFCCALLSANINNAQMVGSNVYLQGKYVEVGMNPNGSYGASSSPTTYHSHMTTAGTPGGALGFVADVGMDGWTVGSPAYMGDYFYPGSPFEGWELQVNGRSCQAFNTSGASSYVYSGGMPAITGTSVSYATGGTKVIATWQGTIDSIDIIQTTTVDTNNLYFTVKVVLTNTASLPRNNIYYFRSVDADNDQTWPGGGFTTNNLIEYQTTDTTIVSATGLSSSSAYLAFGTTDTAAMAVIYNVWPKPAGGLASGYMGSSSFSGPSFYTPGVTHFGDIAIGLIINIPHLATVDSMGDSVYRTTAGSAFLHPANQATLNYFYAFSTAARDSAVKLLDGSSTPGSTLAIKNVNNNADIKVYPNPSGEVVNITNLATNDRIMVYDIMGRDMQQNWQAYHDGTVAFRYKDVPTGAYVLIVMDENGNVKSRIPVRKL